MNQRKKRKNKHVLKIVLEPYLVAMPINPKKKTVPGWYEKQQNSIASESGLNLVPQ